MNVFFRTRIFKCCQKFSTGLRSGLFPGHGNTSMPLFWNYALNTFAVWHRAESCWKTKGALLGKRDVMEGINFGFRTVSIIFLPFRMPSVTWIRPTPSADIHAQIMTFVGFFVIASMQSGWSASPTLRLPIFYHYYQRAIFYSHCSRLLASIDFLTI